MVFYAQDESPPPKSFFTHGVLPAFINEKQIPQKRKPFSTILNQKWSHSLDLILPEEILQVVQDQLDVFGSFTYAKVIMSLSEIIKGDFFTEYIKKGNILMLSEGIPGVHNLFSLYEGVLRLEVDRPTYERMGLVGRPIPDGGLKHKKNRYAIEVDLRLPSMLHGKKGFERVVWAFTRVLTHSLVWLFHDCENNFSQESAPIAKHHPLWMVSNAQITTLPDTKTPSPLLSGTTALQMFKDDLFSADLEEWIGLAALGSQRLQNNDNIDPYLCRYTIPSLHESENEIMSEEPSKTENLVRLRWRGFLPSEALISLVVSLRKPLKQHWIAMVLSGFRNESLTLMKLPQVDAEEHFVEWYHPAKL